MRTYVTTSLNIPKKLLCLPVYLKTSLFQKWNRSNWESVWNKYILLEPVPQRRKGSAAPCHLLPHRPPHAEKDWCMHVQSPVTILRCYHFAIHWIVMLTSSVQSTRDPFSSAGLGELLIQRHFGHRRLYSTIRFGKVASC